MGGVMIQSRWLCGAALVVAAAISGCQNQNSATGVNNGIAFVVVTGPSSAVMVNQTLPLTAQAYNETDTEVFNVSFVWSSSNTSVATVDSNGVVTGVSVGTTTINAKGGGQLGQAVITVTQPPGDAG
jgi:uncharacterized protein YjdB